MGKWKSILRWAFVSAGIIILTSITVDATLSPNGFSQSALGILATNVTEKECPNGTARIDVDGKGICVDQYEASPSTECVHETVGNALETRENSENRQCIPQSASGKLPWAFVTYHQAKELCAKAGKRLLTNREWYEAVVGTPDERVNPSCNTKGVAVLQSGEKVECATEKSIHDGIGNVWEWVDETVNDGVYDSETLPESGYVTAADESGVARTTSADGVGNSYHDDYFWSDQNGQFGMIRGGFFGSGKDAGMYSIQAKTALSFSGNAIGFRCALSL